MNLTGFFHVTQRAVRQMVAQGSGHVVNISTSLVDHADSSRPSALASLTKGALAAVGRSLAIEYASRGVRVNAVSLGVIRTAMNDPADPAAYQSMAAFHPLGRMGRSATSSTGSSISNGRRSSPGRSCILMVARSPGTDWRCDFSSVRVS